MLDRFVVKEKPKDMKEVQKYLELLLTKNKVILVIHNVKNHS